MFTLLFLCLTGVLVLLFAIWWELRLIRAAGAPFILPRPRKQRSRKL